MGPLDGVRAVELAGKGPVPFAGMVLADLGADVIRVDRVSEVPEPTSDGALTERGKRSVALDLKRPVGAAVVRALLETADILLDPFRPGVLERLGLGPETCLDVNRRLVYARMTGWGQSGSLSRRAGHDINYIALAGALHDIGPADRPPTPPLNLVGDYGGGAMLLIVGVLAALLERARSGEGQVVDAAMLDGAALMMTTALQLQALGLWRERGEHFLAGAAPWYCTYRTSDGGYVAVGAVEPRFYGALLDGLGLSPEEWPQHEPHRWPRQRERIAALFAARSRDEWCTHFADTDACVTPVLSLREAPEWPHNREREVFAVSDGLAQVAPAPRFGRTPGAIHGAPCRPGQHSRDVLREAGLGDDDIAELEAAGATRQLAISNADGAD